MKGDMGLGNARRGSEEGEREEAVARSREEERGEAGLCDVEGKKEVGLAEV